MPRTQGLGLLKLADLLESKKKEVAAAREIRRSASYRARRDAVRLTDGATVALQSMAVKFGAGIVADPKLEQKMRYSLCPFFTLNIYTALALLFCIWAKERRRRSRNVSVAHRSYLLSVCCKTSLWEDSFGDGLL